MKKIWMKCAAVLSVGVGLWMVALPAWAAYKACITDGGEHEIPWSTCRSGEDTPCEGDCGWKKWVKGYYCADTQNHSQCASQPNRLVDVYRRDSQCIVHAVNGQRVGCKCSESTFITPWYLSSEKEEAGVCETTVVP